MNPLPSQFLRYRTILVALFQALLVFTALVLAWLLLFDFSLPYRGLLFSAAPLLILIRLAAIGRFDLFHGWWRYTGVSDALDIVKAIALGSAMFLFVMRFLLGVVSFPRTIYILEAVLSIGLLAGVRLLSRVFTESMSAVVGSSRKVMLIGAGSAAQIIIREIHRWKNSPDRSWESSCRAFRCSGLSISSHPYWRCSRWTKSLSPCPRPQASRCSDS